MDIFLEFENNNSTVKIPLSKCEINKIRCNDNLQHENSSATVSFCCSSELLNVLISQTQSLMKIKNEAAIIFTGIAKTDLIWADNGNPEPIEDLSLTIEDLGNQLLQKTTSEIALLNTTLRNAVLKILTDCSVNPYDISQVPEIPMQVFLIDSGKTYKSVLTDLLFAYGIMWSCNNLGEFTFSSFMTIPQSNTFSILDENSVLSPVETKKTNKSYTGVTIGYNTLVQKNNELIYFSGNGYDSDGTPSAAVVQPNVYFPFESDPALEASDGQVYHNYESGFAEIKTKLNGEKEFSRSKKTTLIYSYDHQLTEDWKGSITVNRTEFGSQKASIRLLNTGSSDAYVYSISLRAKAIYRNDDCYVSAGSEANTYNYDSEYLYTAEYANNLAACVHRFLSNGQYKTTVKIDSLAEVQQYIHFDAGMSGWCADYMVIAQKYDYYKEQSVITMITIGPASIVTARQKNSFTNTTEAAFAYTAKVETRVAQIENGNAETAPTPDNLIIEKCAAVEKGVQIVFKPLGNGVKNTIKNIIWQISKNSGESWSVENTESIPSFSYEFNRVNDGYPENSSLLNWRIRARAVNIYNQRSSDWVVASVDVSSYGTWIPASPTSLSTIATENEMVCSWNYIKPNNYYGNIEFDVAVKYNGNIRKTVTVYSGTSTSYVFNRDVDGYPEKQANAVGNDSDLSLYSFVVTARNTESGTETISTAAPQLDDSSYLTWKLQTPAIESRVSGRSCTLFIAQPVSVYGNITSRIQIKKISPTPDTRFYEPTPNTNPYSDENNYKDETSGESEYVSCNATYQQILPLEGQNTEEPSPVDTGYAFRCVSTNESGNLSSEAIINIIALATSTYDLVNASVTSNKIADGAVVADKIHANAVTADKISTPNLAAINANLGVVSGGVLKMGSGESDTNIIVLDDTPKGDGSTWIKGTVFLGDENQYFKITPVSVNGVITRDIALKAGTITFDSTGFSGDLKEGTYVIDSNVPTRRLKLTYSGIIVQEYVNGDWTSEASVIIDDSGSLVISNSTDRPCPATELPTNSVVYHFDDTVLDNNGENSKSIITAGALDDQDNAGLKTDNGCFRGTVQIPNSSALGDVLFFTKADFARVYGKRLYADGSVGSSVAENFNANASTSWGLTQEQVDAKIAREV